MGNDLVFKYYLKSIFVLLFYIFFTGMLMCFILH